MNRYICTSCGKWCYSAASPDAQADNRCPRIDCDGAVVPDPETMATYTKPPLGIMPDYIWREHRRDALKDAINRCFDLNYPVKPHWIAEYNQLVKETTP